MILPFRMILLIMAIATGVVTSFSVFAEEIYDRLDGKGPSSKKVDVVEWEENLEVHVYPKGSLRGLSAKLDDRVEGKKVMVVGYRFGAKDHLVRRAILGVPFDKNVKGFIDRTEKDFDKLAISNQTMPAPWTSYKFDPAPAQWYPDGDERNDVSDPAQVPYLGEMKKTEEAAPAVERAQSSRKPASVNPSTAEPTSKPQPRGENSLNQFNW